MLTAHGRGTTGGVAAIGRTDSVTGTWFPPPRRDCEATTECRGAQRWPVVPREGTQDGQEGFGGGDH